jgi:membrane-bound lytic murein transglycosylase B
LHRRRILAQRAGFFHVAANALNSTANFLKANGWRAGYSPATELRRDRSLERDRGVSEGDCADGTAD